MPVDLYLPPKPAIIRLADPWEREVSRDLIAKGVPLHVRQDVVSALRKVFGGRNDIARAQASDLEEYVKRSVNPMLALGGSFASFLTASGSASAIFPEVRSTAAGSGGSTSATSHNAGLPSSYNSGDLLILIMAAQINASGAWNTPSGWTSFLTGFNGNSQGHVRAVYKTASGSEGSTVTITNAAATRASWNSYAIYNHDSGQAPTSQASPDSGASTTADPPSLTPSWGSYKNLWIALVSSKESNTPSVNPTSYGNAITGTVTATNGPTLHSVRRQLEASSDDPSAFTIGSSRFVVGTIAVKGGTA